MYNRVASKNNDPDLAGLKDFALTPDRKYARFFVGRGEVLDDINTAWQWRMEQWHGGDAEAFDSSTQIVMGAPGAGKTSVGTRLASELWAPHHPDHMFSTDDEEAPVVVNLDPLTLNDQIEVFIRICQAIKPGSEKKLKRVSSTHGYELGGGIPGVVKGGYHQSSTRHEQDSPTVVNWRLLGEALGEHNWKRPVCLLIDEAQTLDLPGIKFLATIHRGTHQLPIFSILLGLGNTEMKLQQGGISRPEGKAVHILPALTDKEVEYLCARYFTTFRIKGTSARKKEFATALHKWSAGWPSHMHNALKGLTTELLKTNGDLTRVNFTTSMTHAQSYRDHYYRLRRGGVFANSPAFLGEFMARLDARKVMPSGEIDAHIEQAQKIASEDLLDRRIGTYSVEELFNHLLHQGFIQENNEGDYVCPIPSLRSWCLKRADMEDPLLVPQNRASEAKPAPTRTDQPRKSPGP